jgi:hypothetical protein
LIVGKVFPDTLLTHWLLMSNFVALILTFGSITVVAVAIWKASFILHFCLCPPLAAFSVSWHGANEDARVSAEQDPSSPAEAQTHFQSKAYTSAPLRARYPALLLRHSQRRG